MTTFHTELRVSGTRSSTMVLNYIGQYLVEGFEFLIALGSNIGLLGLIFDDFSLISP